jgi:hypothetical protein
VLPLADHQEAFGKAVGALLVMYPLQTLTYSIGDGFTGERCWFPGRPMRLLALDVQIHRATILS